VFKQTQDDDQRLKTEKLMFAVVLDAISPIQQIVKKSRFQKHFSGRAK